MGIMDVVCERVPFSKQRCCSLVLVNFHKLSSRADIVQELNEVRRQPTLTRSCPALLALGKLPLAISLQFGWRELLCACAGLCRVSLPDIEESAVYSSLTEAGARVLVALESRQGKEAWSVGVASFVLEDRGWQV